MTQSEMEPATLRLLAPPRALLSYYSRQLNGTHNKYVLYILMKGLVYNDVACEGQQTYIGNIF